MNIQPITTNPASMVAHGVLGTNQPKPSSILQEGTGPTFAETLATPPETTEEKSELREAFDSFVGQTFYGEMLKAMRKSVHKPAYFHGGRAEEIFQGQLDQVLSEKMTEASADQFTGPMFELFNLSRG